MWSFWLLGGPAGPGGDEILGMQRLQEGQKHCKGLNTGMCTPESLGGRGMGGMEMM